MKIGKIQQRVLDNIALYNEFELLEYIRGKNAKVKLKCLNCGFKFERYACHFNSYPHICPKCHPKGVSQKITLEEAQRRIDNVYPNHFKILNYSGNNDKCDVQCLLCENTFKTVPASIWRKRLRGCPNCEKILSLGEQAIKTFLEQNKIQYIQQYRFEDCKYKQPLPFDFYLPQKNICIEFQGEQHYKKRSLYYSEDIIIRDNIKKEYCERNNIKLIIIPYTEIDNIPKFLDFHGKD